MSGSDFAYYDVLRRLWSTGETVCILEHDVEPEGALIPEFAACPQPYCSIALSGLACVKFGQDLMQRWPEVFEEMGPTHWAFLDTYVRGALEGGATCGPRGPVTCAPGRGVQRHLHPLHAWHRGGSTLTVTEWQGAPRHGAKGWSLGHDRTTSRGWRPPAASRTLTHQ